MLQRKNGATLSEILRRVWCGSGGARNQAGRREWPVGERPAGGNVAIALLANTIATGAALVALILTLGPISGAHFNPAVTLADA
jgi:glycerol uptake facilitator-like aquaporin